MCRCLHHMCALKRMANLYRGCLTMPPARVDSSATITSRCAPWVHTMQITLCNYQQYIVDRHPRFLKEEQHTHVYTHVCQCVCCFWKIIAGEAISDLHASLKIQIGPHTDSTNRCSFFAECLCIARLTLRRGAKLAHTYHHMVVHYGLTY